MHWEPATMTDDETIVELCMALYREDPGAYAVSANQVRRTLGTFRANPDRGRALVLREHGSAVMGYALLVPFWSNEMGGNLLVVDELYIRAEARSRGAATDLLHRLSSLSDPLAGDAVAIQLEVTDQNERALGLYQRNGFAPRNRILRRERN